MRLKPQFNGSTLQGAAGAAAWRLTVDLQLMFFFTLGRRQIALFGRR
jgi:hypothetical protein